MYKLVLYLNEREQKALQELGRRCVREPRHQAKVIILNELISYGLLSADEYFPKDGEDKSDGATG